MFTHMMAKIMTPAAVPIWTYADPVDLTNNGANDLTTVTLASGLSGDDIQDIEVLVYEASTATNDGQCVRLGDSGGFETTGYDCSVTSAGSSEYMDEGFFAEKDSAGSAANVYNSVYRIMKFDGNIWMAVMSGTRVLGTTTRIGFGHKELTGELTQVQFTTSAGITTFDRGYARLRWR